MVLALASILSRATDDWSRQGTLTEGKGSVQLTSSLRKLVLLKR
jgi:hypothetical protein